MIAFLSFNYALLDYVIKMLSMTGYKMGLPRNLGMSKTDLDFGGCFGREKCPFYQINT